MFFCDQLRWKTYFEKAAKQILLVHDIDINLIDFKQKLSKVMDRMLITFFAKKGSKKYFLHRISLQFSQNSSQNDLYFNQLLRIIPCQILLLPFKKFDIQRNFQIDFVIQSEFIQNQNKEEFEKVIFTDSITTLKIESYKQIGEILKSQRRISGISEFESTQLNSSYSNNKQTTINYNQFDDDEHSFIQKKKNLKKSKSLKYTSKSLSKKKQSESILYYSCCFKNDSVTNKLLLDLIQKQKQKTREPYQYKLKSPERKNSLFQQQYSLKISQCSYDLSSFNLESDEEYLGPEDDTVEIKSHKISLQLIDVHENYFAKTYQNKNMQQETIDILTQIQNKYSQKTKKNLKQQKINLIQFYQTHFEELDISDYSDV